MISKKYVRIPELKEYCGISRSTIYRWFKAGILTKISVGRCVLISLEQVDSHLESLKNEQAKQAKQAKGSCQENAPESTAMQSDAYRKL